MDFLQTYIIRMLHLKSTHRFAIFPYPEGNWPGLLLTNVLVSFALQQSAPSSSQARFDLQ
jgi:hypothetical protein